MKIQTYPLIIQVMCMKQIECCHAASAVQVNRSSAASAVGPEEWH